MNGQIRSGLHKGSIAMKGNIPGGGIVPALMSGELVLGSYLRESPTLSGRQTHPPSTWESPEGLVLKQKNIRHYGNVSEASRAGAGYKASPLPSAQLIFVYADSPEAP